MTKKLAVPEMPIRILKIATCSTLSGRSQLTYHVGSNAESEGYVRVVQNSGNGQFNSEWVALSLIEKLLSGHPADKPMTSAVLRTVFRGKSSNSPAFLFAVLLTEALVQPGANKDSGYLIGDVEAFKQAMSALLTSDTDLAVVKESSDELPKRKRSAKESA